MKFLSPYQLPEIFGSKTPFFILPGLPATQHREPLPGNVAGEADIRRFTAIAEGTAETPVSKMEGLETSVAQDLPDTQNQSPESLNPEKQVRKPLPGNMASEADIRKLTAIEEGAAQTPAPKKEDREATANPGDVVLSHLQLTPPQNSTTEPVGDSIRFIRAAAGEIAVNIMATTQDHRGCPEVRMVLKEPALMGTEVRISHNPGHINVNLIPADPASRHLLRKHLVVLEKRLKRQTGKSIKIRMV